MTSEAARTAGDADSASRAPQAPGAADVPLLRIEG